MKELPILFSGPMVRAILDGRKTMTRRLVTPQPTALDGGAVLHWNGPMRYRKVFESDADFRRSWPEQSRFQVGRRMWVRETFGGDDLNGFVYQADHLDADLAAGDLDDGEQSIRRWRPSIHMRRADSRITLVVTAHCVEKLHEITEADAKAEGASPAFDDEGTVRIPARVRFIHLWDSINGKRAPWSSNPWVEVVSFERVTP